MPTELSLAQHLEGLRASMVAFVRYADRAGLGAEVPTCPGWSVRSLVAHQGMVHRWATALLRGERVDPDAVEEEGATAPDPLEWLRDGAIEVARAVTAGGDETRGLVFLNDAPEPAPGSGPGASATRPPSTRSTPSRPRWVATRAPTTPGSTRRSRWTGSTSCSPGS